MERYNIIEDEGGGVDARVSMVVEEEGGYNAPALAPPPIITGPAGGPPPADTSTATPGLVTKPARSSMVVRGSFSSQMVNREEATTPDNKEEKRLEEQRRLEAQLLGEPENIQVLVRVRPRLASEVDRGAGVVVSCVKEANKSYVNVEANARRGIRCK